MAWTKVSLDPSTWTQVSAASATEVTLFLPKSIKRKWSDDSIAVVVADSAPSAGESDLEIYLQNNPDQPIALLNIPLESGDEAYARWDGPDRDAADRYVIRA